MKKKQLSLVCPKDILKNESLNKGTSFSIQERIDFCIEGLLPSSVESQESQVLRIRYQLSLLSTPLEKYMYLVNLQNRNETLFYNIIMSNPEVYLPIVYDPTVGEACLKFHLIFSESRGVYISESHRGKIKNILAPLSSEDIRFIVITDGSRILGLGDLGANGMGIPIGKLALYTAVGSINPKHLLPVFFDMGTNNVSYLNDPLYLGLRKNRIEGDDYFSLMDEFVLSVQELFPHCCIQFEDFENYKAIPLLKKYRDKFCIFNDDIQGTAAVTVSAFYTAEKIMGKKISQHTILFLGAGSAAQGIADLLCLAMQKENLSEKDAISRCWMFDTKGLVVEDRPRLEEFKKKYAKKADFCESFLECIKKIKPTAIIGVSTTPHLFTQEILEEMAKINSVPLILPLSNPTSQEECLAEEAYRFTKGKALFAAGVLFDEVVLGDQVYYPTQANNLWIFPAIGMAVYVTKSSRVTDEMFLIAAQTLSAQISEEDLKKKKLYPSEAAIINISIKIAAAVARYIFDNGFASVERPEYDDHIIDLVRKNCYHPFYSHF